MTSFKKYFSYRFKSSLLLTFIIGFICMIITFFSVDVIIKEVLPDYYPEYMIRANIFSDIYPLALILSFLCIIVPCLELYSFKEKRNLDAIFSLPISRRGLCLAHYLNGAIKIAIAYTLCVIATIIRFIPYAEHFKLIYFIPFYFCSLIYALLIYSIAMFLLVQANTLIDGIFFVLGYSVVFLFVATALSDIFSVFSSIEDSFFMFNSIAEMNDIFNDLIDMSEVSFNYEDLIAYCFWGILGIASIFGYIFTFERQRADEIGGISNTWFGYKVLIPTITISLFTLDADFYIWGLIGMFVAYVVYRRSIKIKRQDLIVMLITAIIGVFGWLL